MTICTLDRVRQSTDRATVVHLLTGFLGSGKTTLLQRHLAAGMDEETAVLINEFGEVGLDHRLVVAGDATVQMIDNGCLCCAVAGRLRECLHTLLAQRKRTNAPPFRRLIIETSGLACPEPILNTIRTDYALHEYLRIGTIVTTLDAVNAASSLERHSEALRQVCAADRIVITKADLVESGVLRALEAQTRALNPLAALEIAGRSTYRDAALFDDPGNGSRAQVANDNRSHIGAYRSFAVTYSEPLDWARFSLWLTALLNRHGRSILRFKAILALRGGRKPVVVHGVQHLMYPPRHLRALPEGQQGSSMVFIVDGLDPQRIIRSLNLFMEAEAHALAA